ENATSLQTPTATPDSFSGYRHVIHDTFEGAESSVDWFIDSDETYSANIVNGAYQIVLSQFDEERSGSIIWGSIQGLWFDDYIVRARVRVLQDGIRARTGLWLHYQDGFNFLYFGIDNIGRYRVAKFQGIYTEFQPWIDDDAIHQGAEPNILEIKLEGDVFTFSVNGKTLLTTSDDTFKEGRIAFFCDSNTENTTCHLEEIDVWIPEDSPFPRPTHTPTSEAN
ncbi:MAG TPA: hypothetical protein VJZ27_15300, partial [Aggregatilineales bacterium]|nr:hypothetical protein [Aggregatilineales bacterium]